MSAEILGLKIILHARSKFYFHTSKQRLAYTEIFQCQFVMLAIVA